MHLRLAIQRVQPADDAVHLRHVEPRLPAEPFGGARASGTNDKAGSPQNLLRWTSARSIKETFVPAKTHLYPHQSPEVS